MNACILRFRQFKHKLNCLVYRPCWLDARGNGRYFMSVQIVRFHTAIYWQRTLPLTQVFLSNCVPNFLACAAMSHVTMASHWPIYGVTWLKYTKLSIVKILRCGAIILPLNSLNYYLTLDLKAIWRIRGDVVRIVRVSGMNKLVRTNSSPFNEMNKCLSLHPAATFLLTRRGLTEMIQLQRKKVFTIRWWNYLECVWNRIKFWIKVSFVSVRCVPRTRLILSCWPWRNHFQN